VTPPEDAPSIATRVGILLVDDREENLVALRGILSAPDHHLVTATTGQEALTRVLQEDFAVILLDVVMPEMSGFEVADHLRGLERTRRIPIIFLTGLATDVEQLYRAYSVGAVDYLIKPLEPVVVRKKVEVFVDLHRQRVEIEEQARRLRESERREYEIRTARLRLASDRRYKKLVEGIDHAIAWTMDPRTRVLSFVSRQAEQILGYSMDELSQPGFWEAHLPPAAREKNLSNFAAALEQGDDTSWGHGFVAADGRHLWFHTSISAERESVDEEPEIHGISVDVTELKRAERSQRLMASAADLLVDTNDQHQAMVKLANLVVPELADWCVIDDFAEDTVRSQACAHADPDKATLARGLNHRHAFGPDAPRAIAHVFRTGESLFHGEVADAAEIATALGLADVELAEALGAVSYFIVPLRGRKRRLGVMTLLSTAPSRRFGPAELALAEELARRAALVIENALLYLEARDANRARAEIMAVVSHDLRNPLSAIRMSADRLVQVTSTGAVDGVAKAAETIRRAATRMGRMLDDLRDIEHIDADRLPIDRRVHEVGALVSDCVELLTPLAEEKQLTLRAVTDAAASIEICCDRDRILQVFSNLVGNAIKFSPRRSIVTVRAEGGDDTVTFVVEDTGPGIAAEHLSHVFDRHWQAEETAKQGTGLGLAITRGIVEAHGGRVWVRSEVGKGSAFYFELPIDGGTT
jgi:PAS domain S-box-containing protein